VIFAPTCCGVYAANRFADSLEKLSNPLWYCCLLAVASVETTTSGDGSQQNVVVPQQDEPMEAVSNEDIDLVPDHSSV
jgi:hypothetical protein